MEQQSSGIALVAPARRRSASRLSRQARCRGGKAAPVADVRAAGAYAALPWRKKVQ